MTKKYNHSKPIENKTCDGAAPGDCPLAKGRRRRRAAALQLNLATTIIGSICWAKWNTSVSVAHMYMGFSFCLFLSNLSRVILRTSTHIRYRCSLERPSGKKKSKKHTKRTSVDSNENSVMSHLKSPGQLYGSKHILNLNEKMSVIGTQLQGFGFRF